MTQCDVVAQAPAAYPKKLPKKSDKIRNPLSTPVDDRNRASRNAEPTVLPSDKGKDTVILSTSDY
jgi:hypothetical protein